MPLYLLDRRDKCWQSAVICQVEPLFCRHFFREARFQGWHADCSRDSVGASRGLFGISPHHEQFKGKKGDVHASKLRSWQASQ
jgi:hypothetical protein